MNRPRTFACPDCGNGMEHIACLTKRQGGEKRTIWWCDLDGTLVDEFSSDGAPAVARFPISARHHFCPYCGKADDVDYIGPRGGAMSDDRDQADQYTCHTCHRDFFL